MSTASLLVGLFLLFTQASLTRAAWPFTLSGQITTSPLTGDLTVNLKTDTVFILDHTAPIQLCFQESFLVPKNTTQWSVGCTFYFTFPANDDGQSNGTIALRQSTYNVAIYFAQGTSPGEGQVSLQVGNGAEDICPTDQIWNFGSNACEPTTQLIAGINSVDFVANVSRIFRFALPTPPALTGSVTISGMDSSLSFATRRAGAPSTKVGFFDGTSGLGSAFVGLPRLGQYFLYVSASSVDIQVNITLKFEDCTNSPSHGGGPGCKLLFNHDNSAENLIAIENQFMYWVVTAKPDAPLRVSVSSNDASPNPRIYATLGQLPQEGNADISGCNVEPCGVANIISRTVTSEELWYIAVTSAPGHNGTSYGIWFESVCAPSCDFNGQCMIDPPITGQCICNNEGDTGVGCQISSSLSQQYVVLAAIWGTAIGLTLVIVVTQFLTSSKDTYERLA